MLSVVTWKWKQNIGWIDYTAANVNHLRNQIDRFIGVPYRFYCITDDPKGLNPNIITLPIEELSSKLPAFTDSVHLRSCYRRLRLFAPEIEQYVGKRILQLDIDMVITGDISHIAKRTEPFIIWRSFSHGHRSKYRNFALNTSVILMDAGARADIWNAFNGKQEEIARAAAKNYWVGTDQAVIGYIAYKSDTDPPTFSKEDGIYAFRDDPKECQGNELAPGVKLISFHDRFNPADPKLHRQCKWLDRAWKESDDNVYMLSVGEKIQRASREHVAADARQESVATP